MINVWLIIKDYLIFIKNIGNIALAYLITMLLLFITFVLIDTTGFCARIHKGSRKTIKFFKEKGWIDNSNLQTFLMKCMKKFPYIIRANFSLYSNSDKHLTEFIDEKCYNYRDYSIRERLIKYIYDFVMITGAIITFIDILNAWGLFVAIRTLFTLLGAFVLRYILMGIMMLREILSKKNYYKAIDLMSNGTFLPNKKNDNNSELEAQIDEFLDNVSSNIDNSNAKIKRVSDNTGIIIDKKAAALEDIAIDKTH